MKIAIVTGASAGLGEAFAQKLRLYFPEVERIWLIARRRERLEELAGRLDKVETEVLPLDLCDPTSFLALSEKLTAEKPEVRLLINNAGCGYLGNVGEGDVVRQVRMTNLNVTALTAVTHLVLPHMAQGSRIVNVSSIASFCPNPRMTVYSSTKAYVSSFTRGLSVELRGRGIGVTAVCPGPMATEFCRWGILREIPKPLIPCPTAIRSGWRREHWRRQRRGGCFIRPGRSISATGFWPKCCPMPWWQI